MCVKTCVLYRMYKKMDVKLNFNELL